MNIKRDCWFLRLCAVNHNARMCLLGFHGNSGVRRGRRSKVRPVHRQEHGRSRWFQTVVHGHVHLLRRHAHLLAVLRRRLPLYPLVRLVWVFREGLAVLESPEQPDEEPEEDERPQARDEGQALDVQAGSRVAAVEEHVPLHVGDVAVGVDVGGAPLVGEGAVVEEAERFRFLHCEDLLARPDVLTVLVGLVEDLVLPHVEVQNQHEEDDAVVEPLTCNETRDFC